MRGVFKLKELMISAYAKINLTLDVLRKRPDGYHDVEMIMQEIDLHDQMILREKDDKGIEIRCDHPLVPEDESNLAYRAAALLMEEVGIDRGIQIEIIKNIPVAAGLAGGSTNGAAVLMGLNKLWQLGFSKEELMNFGARLGADVPFCILGGTALASGIGTDLKSISPLPEMELILVKPEISVSTKEIYSNYSPELINKRPDLNRMLNAIDSRDCQGIKKNLVNVFEDITMHHYPKVAEVKKVMEDVGLHPVLMSGSGPTLFAIVDDEDTASRYAEILNKKKIGEVIRTRTRSDSSL